MLNIEEQLAYITTRIETEDGNGNLYSGTGFFFNLKMPNGTREQIIVTNKHVVKDMVKGTFFLTERKNEQDAPNDGVYMRIKMDGFEQMWIQHPSPDVDLCIMPLKPLLIFSHNQYNKHFFYRCIGEEQLPKESDYEYINAISEVLMIGYPHGIWDDVNNRPIIRKGLTATDVKFDFKGQKEFVIDMACIPGSSGSPIVVYNNGMVTTRSGNLELGKTLFYLLGILHAGPIMTIEGKIEVKSIPTGLKSVPVAKSGVMINLGYCVKSQYLLDFIPMLNALYRK